MQFINILPLIFLYPIYINTKDIQVNTNNTIISDDKPKPSIEPFNPFSSLNMSDPSIVEKLKNPFFVMQLELARRNAIHVMNLYKEGPCPPSIEICEFEGRTFKAMELKKGTPNCWFPPKEPMVDPSLYLRKDIELKWICKRSDNCEAEGGVDITKCDFGKTGYRRVNDCNARLHACIYFGKTFITHERFAPNCWRDPNMFLADWQCNYNRKGEPCPEGTTDVSKDCVDLSSY